MPHIFSGASSIVTPYGSITYKGQGDKALIIFHDKKHGDTTAEIKAYPLNQLEKKSIFKHTIVSIEGETLVHNWFTRRSSTTLIKFASDKQDAMVFTSAHNLDAHFQEARQFAALTNLSYFNEYDFCRKLNTQYHTSIHALKEHAHMSTRLLKFFLAHAVRFYELLDLGFSIEQLISMEVNRLGLLFENYHKVKSLILLKITSKQVPDVELDKLRAYFSAHDRLDSVLEFISIQQLLGLDHTPKKLNPPPRTMDKSLKEIVIVVDQTAQMQIFLKDKGFLYADFTKLEGMSLDKIHLLSHHIPILDKMLLQGIRLEDFARVDQMRLSYILKNYAKAEEALEFVDLSELLGLKMNASRQKFSFFKPGEKEVVLKKSTSICLVM